MITRSAKRAVAAETAKSSTSTTSTASDTSTKAVKVRKTTKTIKARKTTTARKSKTRKITKARTTAKVGKTTKVGMTPKHEAPIRRQTIPFLQLAPELRNKIYTQALVRRRTLKIGICANFGRKCDIYLANTILFPSFRGTNHQVHKEANGMLYGANTFHFTNIAALTTFLRTVGKDCIRHLRHIELDLPEHAPEYDGQHLALIEHATALESFEVFPVWKPSGNRMDVEKLGGDRAAFGPLSMPVKAEDVVAVVDAAKTIWRGY